MEKWIFFYIFIFSIAAIGLYFLGRKLFVKHLEKYDREND
jgi:hypothetical protein